MSDAAAIVAHARRLVPDTFQAILDNEAELLAQTAAALPAGAVIVELGTRNGFSAAVLALAAPRAHIMTIDIEPGPRAGLRGFTHVQEMQGVSWQCAERVPAASVDLLFIDADHTCATRDLKAWRSRLKPGAAVVFHDYVPRFPDVIAAANSLGVVRTVATGDRSAIVVCYAD